MSRVLRDVLDESNPNKAPSALQEAKIGSALAISPRFTQGEVSSNVLALPEEARAAQVLTAFARAGSSTGYLTPAAPHATPGEGEVAVDPEGNIVFNATDAVTDAEVLYVPVEGEIFEEEIDVGDDGSASFLQSREGLVLLEAELLDEADSAGSKTIVARGGTISAGEAALTDTGAPAFNSTDVGDDPVRARVKYIARPEVGEGVEDTLGTRLDGEVDF